MSREFILKRGSLQERFLNMTSKIQVYGGGFGNGKTTALVIKALQLVQDYPGCTGLLARSTYPKLNDTLRKEFIKWCPPEFIKSFPTGQNSSNICTLKNGSQIYFRYIAQQGNSERGTTSNLLSATYDFVGVDQIEDPEITHKDFLDLFGRLRGSARYMGDDVSMPRTGPRWMMLACNPTGNWVYTKIVRPLHIYLKTGMITKELLCVRDPDGNAILDAQGKPQLLLDIVEGSTYELRHIHEADGGDFIQTQESMYQGQMRERFLMGKWASFEGLVYPKFDISTHGVHETDIREYLEELRANGYEPAWVEGYDFGQSSPSAYLLGFTTPHGQVIICDGFYEKELVLDDQFDMIKARRDKWLAPQSEIGAMEVDPSIFGRKGITRSQVGKKISDMFVEAGIKVRKGNNDIQSGIVKVGQYIALNRKLPDPFTKCLGAPRLYVNLELAWFNDEISSYYWKQNGSGEYIDRPNDTNDHAMDALKYMLSRQPDVGNLFTPAADQIPSFLKWHMTEHTRNTRSHRYG